jgi:large subunit ribosomal protein L32
MGVPSRHHTRSRVDKRRSHAALKPLNLVKCSHCGEMIAPHQVCSFCGYYKENEIVDVFKGLNKKEKKKKQKEIEEEK